MASFSYLALVVIFCFLPWSLHSLTFSSRLVHRFSDEARGVAASRGVGKWPNSRSTEYYDALVRSDLQRQKRRLGGRYQRLYPSEGSETFSLGNDFGWLHYTWIDIGTPNVSFLVALDAGSDLLWVPCDCIQCAPLSGYHSSLVVNRPGFDFTCKYLSPILVDMSRIRIEVQESACSLVYGASIMQDKDLGMYSPSESRTSRHVPCSHEMCALGSSCKSPKQPCPYNINYYSENTSSSGSLVEDVLYLVSSDGHKAVQASVVVGCGRTQSGGYLDGIAPDGLLGLGFGDISVPSFLARSGLVRNSFSMCFVEEDSGRIFFGDQGISTQQSTPFVPLNGKYVTYIVEVERVCIGPKCLGGTGLQALVDSGSSFTFLPDDAYKRITLEFDKQVNGSRVEYTESPWEYCYKASPLKMPEVPTLTLTFAVNKSFVVTNPIFPFYGKEGELAGFCLALQSSAESLGTIGQNFMTGYHMVFDRENLKLGWSQSDCRNAGNSKSVPLTPPPQDRPENPLPTNEQQSSPNGHAVSPDVAGKAPTNSLAVSPMLVEHFCLLLLLTLFTVISIG